MPPHPHCHWRGAKEWKDQGLEMSTTSDEACKMFDASLTQIVNLYDDPALGGMAGTIEKLLKADPECILGHVLHIGLGGQKVANNYDFAQKVYKLAALAEKEHVKPWERKHARAVREYAEGNIDAASAILEDILVDHPMDMLALKLLHDNYIVTGYSQRLKDSCGRVLSYWTPDTPCYGNLLGMYAFGLEETNFYSEAEETARKALDINRHDAWAAHAVMHVKEMKGDLEAGITFMSETENDWSDSHLACHNYWHWGLYYLEKCEFGSAFGLLDKEVIPRMNASRTSFSLTDSATMLHRLAAEGVDLGDRWDDCYDIAKDNLAEHFWCYPDICRLISCLGAGKLDDATHMVQNIRDFARNGFGDIQPIYRDVAVPVMEAMLAYHDGDYGRAVDVMKPVRYDVCRFGGSLAQRDLFNLFEINCALKSHRSEDKKYARHLLLERNSRKAETPLTVRMMKKLT